MTKITATRNRGSGGTKTKLLEAAGPVFARVGFHAATVQEICDSAGANIAAVNYHFGDKLGLYREIGGSENIKSPLLNCACYLRAVNEIKSAF